MLLRSSNEYRIKIRKIFKMLPHYCLIICETWQHLCKLRLGFALRMNTWLLATYHSSLYTHGRMHEGGGGKLVCFKSTTSQAKLYISQCHQDSRPLRSKWKGCIFNLSHECCIQVISCMWERYNVIKLKDGQRSEQYRHRSNQLKSTVLRSKT